jgi:streptogramin lyase
MIRAIRIITIILLSQVCAASTGLSDLALTGRVIDKEGRPVSGVMVTARQTKLGLSRTVFTDAAGNYLIPGLPPGPYMLRARCAGFNDQTVDGVEISGPSKRDFTLSPSKDISDDMAASYWFATIPFASPQQREQFKLDCMVCHQIGSRPTRVPRDHQGWAGVIKAMRGLYAQAAESPAAVQTDQERVEFLGAWSKQGKPRFLPTPPVSREAALATITEFDIGRPDSYCHDLEVTRDGIVWAVDIGQDALYRLDPRTCKRTAYKIPAGESPKINWSFSGYNTRVGPHSVEQDQQGRLWITLAFGNKLAMFDPETESFRVWTVPAPAIYPHTLRVDGEGNIWFTLYISGHIGKFDTKTERFTIYSPPTAGGTHYGIAIAPDGGVWYSQLYARTIGRLDPRTGKFKEYKTPGIGPRRLEIDSKGIVWIPEYGAGLLARFDPRTETFKEFELPTGKAGEAPYALGVDKEDNVWVCGTISDTLIRFDTKAGSFTVVPMPERVTFTREIEFDYSNPRMKVWTINSNDPPTHIESMQPRVICLEPR